MAGTAMDVRHLIAKLQTLDPDMLVLTPNESDEGSYEIVHNVEQVLVRPAGRGHYEREYDEDEEIGMDRITAAVLDPGWYPNA